MKNERHFAGGVFDELLRKERIKGIVHTDIFLVSHLPVHVLTRIYGCGASFKIHLKNCIQFMSCSLSSSVNFSRSHPTDVWLFRTSIQQLAMFFRGQIPETDPYFSNGALWYDLDVITWRSKMFQKVGSVYFQVRNNNQFLTTLCNPKSDFDCHKVRWKK